jgi:uncharacterized protein (DUF302 family)
MRLEGTMSFMMGMMKKVMMQEHRSLYDFDTTVERLRKQSLEVGWNVPMEFPLQAHYVEHGLEDMGRCINLYLCNPQGGYDISRSDAFKPMFVMMPTAVSVYESSGGEVRVARMRLGTMAKMFGGSVKRTLADGERRLRAALGGIVEA